MLTMASFDAGGHEGLSLGVMDLVVIAVILLAVEGVDVSSLVLRFFGTSAETGDTQAAGVRESPQTSLAP